MFRITTNSKIENGTHFLPFESVLTSPSFYFFSFLNPLAGRKDAGFFHVAIKRTLVYEGRSKQQVNTRCYTLESQRKNARSSP